MPEILETWRILIKEAMQKDLRYLYGSKLGEKMLLRKNAIQSNHFRGRFSPRPTFDGF